MQKDVSAKVENTEKWEMLVEQDISVFLYSFIGEF